MVTYLEVVQNALENTSNYEEFCFDILQYDHTAEVFESLIGVPQGTFYHPEFDASVHTYYVCKAVYELGQYDLIEIAFLHDWGKSTMTNVGKDRIYHFGHADESARLVSGRVQFLDGDVEWTLQMIKDHMGIKNPSKGLELFMDCDKRLSKQLYLKDTNEEQLEQNKKLEQSVYQDQHNADSQVIMLIGISGSGKSTYIHQNGLKNVTVCPDDIRKELSGNISDQSMNDKVWKETSKRMLGILAQHGKVVLDATNVNKFLRIKFMSQFNGHRKVAVVFHTDVEVAKNRVAVDIRDGKDRSNVPANVIERQQKNFERGLKSLDHEFNQIIHIQ